MYLFMYVIYGIIYVWNIYDVIQFLFVIMKLLGLILVWILLAYDIIAELEVS
jgi:hypothetical protein